ncbi:hypothetical protein SAMN06296273_0525 [Nitrosomonas ureae]|uniref:Uncharacterized protein n=1 Tax=Nitrosomonas ureae TaxID=44577 RepID=A0A285BV23_9PROT|nr:hypothetical protein [Nitrosomonas ureae]SNX59082.1 hypothetical protein SAMN06296273_0525 [Nitrosomonas ureae]
MDKRVEEVIKRLSERDVIIPTTKRDLSTKDYIKKITSKINKNVIDCIDSETIPHLLINKLDSNIYNKNLIYDDIINQIIDDEKKITILRNYFESTNLKIDEKIILPFGKIYNSPVDLKNRERSGNLGQLLLASNVVSSYREWSKKRTKFSEFAICFQKPDNAGNIDGGLTHIVTDYKEIGSKPIIKKIEELKQKPNFYSHFNFLSTNFYVIGFYLDKIPNILKYDKDDTIDFAKSLSLESYLEQLQILIDIEKIDFFHNEKLILITARYKNIQKINFETGKTSRNLQRSTPPQAAGY